MGKTSANCYVSWFYNRLAIVAIFVVLLRCLTGVTGTPQVPAMFIFGDSIVDNGNNNYLSSMAKANYYPYGIDFYQGATGRFTNGKTVIDILCDLLGLPYPPPSRTPWLNGTRLLGGVNYASAAAGILEESGQFLGDRFNLNQQVLNFQSNLNDIRTALGGGRNLSQYLAKSIVIMVFGSNDYINNYLLPSLYPSSSTYTPQQFGDLLINHYTRQILALYSVGLRKFFLPGVGPLGCIPNQRASGQAPRDRCVDRVNEIVGYFNRGLQALVGQLNTDHPGAIFVYGNTYAALGDILNNPKAFGFTVIDSGCCGVGMDQSVITCVPMSYPCQDRNQHVFWDAFHPTQAVNMILAQKALTGQAPYCIPINVQQLAQL